MLVDVTTPAWSLLYSNDAFTAETGAAAPAVLAGGRLRAQLPDPGNQRRCAQHSACLT